MFRPGFIALATLGLLGGLVGPVSVANSVAAAGPTGFSNPTPITIPDSGPATPYPSTIQVSGLTTPITDVNVVLNGYSHTCPNDVDVLLVAPTGQESLLMADLGSGLGCPDSLDANLTFDDAAASSVPYPPTTGTWKPTDGQPGTPHTFPTPAPAGGTHPASLAAFNGLAGNGTWSLYVVDQNTGDTGSISGGWSLSITTAPEPTRDRTLGLHARYGPKRVVGRLYAAGYPTLYVGQTVTIWKVRPGPDRKVATRTTNGLGKFKLRVRKGRYYATSDALVVPGVGQCTFDQSRVVRVR